MVCEQDNSELHDAPIDGLKSSFKRENIEEYDWDQNDLDSKELLDVLGEFAIGSREPIIREYDHEVQGNTNFSNHSPAKQVTLLRIHRWFESMVVIN